MGSSEGEEKKEGVFLLLTADVGIGFVEEGLEYFVVLKVSFGIADPIKSTPTFLGGYLTLPDIDLRISVGIHVERAR